MRAVVVMLVVGLSACPSPTPRPPAQAALTISTRQSCGVLSGLSYDTTCLGAIALRVLDEARNVKHAECELVGAGPSPVGPFDNLRDVLQADPSLFSFSGLQAKGVVTFELVGLHHLGDGTDPQALCQSPFANDDAFLFFGKSAPVSLAEYDDGTGPPLIEVTLDCRDCTFNDESCPGAQQCRFGCGGIAPAANPAICPVTFPDSLCVPNGGCARVCDEDADCFEGARTCREDGFCDTTTNGALCSPCSDAIGCADGLVCVRKPSGGGAFCALPCPDEPCPSGTKCNRIGNDLVLD